MAELLKFLPLLNILLFAQFVDIVDQRFVSFISKLTVLLDILEKFMGNPSNSGSFRKFLELKTLRIKVHSALCFR